MSNELGNTITPLNSDIAGMSMTDLERHIAVTSVPIRQAAALMVRSLNLKKAVAWCGNGGSDAQAQHFTGELVGRFSFDRPPFKSFALSSVGAVASSIANDYAWEVVLARQVAGLLGPGDVLFGISTSGTSVNVQAAMTLAKQMGVITIAMIGNREPAIVKALGDPDVVIPVVNMVATPEIQQEHLRIGHQLCAIVESTIYGGQQE